MIITAFNSMHKLSFHTSKEVLNRGDYFPIPDKDTGFHTSKEVLNRLKIFYLCQFYQFPYLKGSFKSPPLRTNAWIASKFPYLKGSFKSRQQWRSGRR